MNIAQAKEEIKNTVRIYTRKNEDGSYKIAPVHQRPVLLIGPPGIGKTAIMEQVAKECEIGLVAYTITHHTRQSAVGLPLIKNEVFGGKEYAVTEYTMSEIIASVYQCIEKQGYKEGILFIDRIQPARLEFSGRAGFFLSVVGGAVYRVSGSTEISMSISKARFHGKW